MDIEVPPLKKLVLVSTRTKDHCLVSTHTCVLTRHTGGSAHLILQNIRPGVHVYLESRGQSLPGLQFVSDPLLLPLSSIQ